MKNKEKKELFEDMLIDLLSEGFSLVNDTTSKSVQVTSGYGDAQWEVVEYNELSGKEYKTLKGALVASNKQ